MPGVAPVRRASLNPAKELPRFQPMVMVGLALDDGQVAWGDCLLTDDPDTQGGPSGSLAEAVRTIEQVVAPVITGQRLEDFKDLAGSIDALSALGWKEEKLPAGEEQAPHVTRKDFISGQFLDALAPDDERRIRRVRVVKPLQAGIRFGVTQALLSACAHDRKTCEARVILDAYGLAFIDSSVPIHVELDTIEAGTLIPLLIHRAVSLGYTTRKSNFKETLGQNLENLVRYVQLLQQQTPDLFGEAQRPVVHVNVQGTLGETHENNPGKMLGTLVQLESRVPQYPVRVQDPGIMSTLESQIDLMTRLGGYMRSRKMSTELVAGAWIDSLKSLDAFLEVKAADMIHIDPLRMGGIHHTIQAILACKKKGIPVLLGGSPSETARCAGTAAQLAIATQPDLVMAKPGYQGDVATTHMTSEMARARAQLVHRSN